MCADASAGLQRILQEIQPRDTNDFFTSARELEPQAGDDPDQHDKTKETKGQPKITTPLWPSPLYRLGLMLFSYELIVKH